MARVVRRGFVPLRQVLAYRHMRRRWCRALRIDQRRREFVSGLWARL